MKRGLLAMLAAVALLPTAPLRAHIGSPAVVFDGSAGPYPVRVIILPPPVVPGRAEINVRLLGNEAEPVKVTVLPVSWRAGLNGAPAPDEALPVAGEPALRHAELWLMTTGSYSVHVVLTGPRGSGTVIVPVLSVATQRLPMSPFLGGLLGLLGVLLFAGAVTLVGIGVRESVRVADGPRTASQKFWGAAATVAAALLFGALLYGGKRWWDQEDRNFRANEIYRPLPLRASVRNGGGPETIRLDVGRGGSRNDRPLLLIPDHGKLMHLFLIRDPQLDALAHLHPLRSGPHTFDVAVPPLPAGRYRLYADITYETGFAATLTTTIDLPESARSPATAGPVSRDPDDSWFVGTPARAGAAADRSGSGRSDDFHLVQTGPAALVAGRDVTLNFAMLNGAGHPAEIEPYMGMLGHAAIRRSDGTVFAHIHPIGTVSMAAQMFFQQQAARQTGVPIPMDPRMHLTAADTATTVSFPYLFPQPGSYRIWVQAKAQGTVRTGVFDLDVAPGS